MAKRILIGVAASPDPQRATCRHEAFMPLAEQISRRYDDEDPATVGHRLERGSDSDFSLA
ncbi:hypothetical protein GONAM_02_00270 [Gordonia namibiensis NBRC 108229]|uniref:Uncharacterized protein n=1 Tax=Gordonia namibiensis NBRC 108229 TaxID=1208314 RepID=K6WGS1_9ACTN|nr:hypothetical protein GONAM_02_00270 [Gordonia namibiensis NBRC 108229]